MNPKIHDLFISLDKTIEISSNIVNNQSFSTLSECLDHILVEDNSNNSSDYDQSLDTKSKSQYREISIEDVNNVFQQNEIFNENEEKLDDYFYLNDINVLNEKTPKFKTNNQSEINRGRKPTKLNKKRHRNDDFDNLQTKIQVHFLSFIIDLSNDAKTTELGQKNKNFSFKDISYKIKKKVSFKSCKQLKNSTIKDILQNEISSKYKHFEKNINKEILNKLSQSSNWLNAFFNQKYLDIFIFYYNNEEPSKEFIIGGKKIVLSNKTKSFYNLLEKNKKIKDKLIDTVKSVYFYGYDAPIKNNSFKASRHDILLNE